MTTAKLLIVDDEELIRKGLRARIEYFQFPNLDVAEAASGQEALDMLRRERFDLALVDISMPGMSGLEMIAQARAQNLSTQFVLLSGYAEFSYAQRAISLGVRAYLNKPVSNDVLRERLDELLQELRAGEAAQELDLEKELNLLLSGGRREDLPGLAKRLPGLFTGEDWLYLGIVHVGKRQDSDAPLPQPMLDALRRAVRAAFDQAPKGCDRLIVNSFHHPQRLYALFLAPNRKVLRREVEQAFWAIRQGVEHRMSAQITMGVSHLDRSLNGRVDEARSALRQRRLYGRSCLYFFEDISASEAQALPEAELELLRKHLVRGDRAAVRRQLESLFSIQRVEECPAIYLHTLWVRAVSQMIGACRSPDAATMNRLLTQLSGVESIVDRAEILRNLTGLADACMPAEPDREMSGAGKIELALNYIRDHFNEEIVINDLAARLDMSPGYFSSMFKREVHQSTMQYITNLRMERAREYLERTDQSVAVIAKSVGYEDSQYFFRVFKKVTGMTPLQYRQTPRDGGEK